MQPHNRSFINIFQFKWSLVLCTGILAWMILPGFTTKWFIDQWNVPFRSFRWIIIVQPWSWSQLVVSFIAIVYLTWTVITLYYFANFVLVQFGTELIELVKRSYKLLPRGILSVRRYATVVEVMLYELHEINSQQDNNIFGRSDY